MAKSVEIGGLMIDARLYSLVRDEIAPGTGVDTERFWQALGEMVRDLGPRNRKLLERRNALQRQIDAWCLARRGQPFKVDEYRTFLTEIGYLVSEGGNFHVETANVDHEIGAVSGPQLLVPLDNARYALNAANARWGSLYDALYGTDVIPEDGGAEKGESYNPVRGAKVIARAEVFLDEAIGLARGKFSDVTRFSVKEFSGAKQLVATLKDGGETFLAHPEKFVGYVEKNDQLASVLLKNNELHVEIQIDRDHPIGRLHPAGVKDVILEAAVTTIQDCEDSVAAVDALDKVTVYRNWNGIMKGVLEATFERNGREMTRRLNGDKVCTAPDGRKITLHGRSLLFVRNVGIHMYTDSVTTSDGQEIPEGFLDAMVTVLAALHDLRRDTRCTNSRTGSVYIVKPKMHGPEEVAATVELFERVEDALGLKRNTLKIGIMDEERRLTVNLKESIRAARERVARVPRPGRAPRAGGRAGRRAHGGARLVAADQPPGDAADHRAGTHLGGRAARDAATLFRGRHRVHPCLHGVGVPAEAHAGERDHQAATARRPGRDVRHRPAEDRARRNHDPAPRIAHVRRGGRHHRVALLVMPRVDRTGRGEPQGRAFLQPRRGGGGGLGAGRRRRVGALRLRRPCRLCGGRLRRLRPGGRLIVELRDRLGRSQAQVATLLRLLVRLATPARPYDGSRTDEQRHFPRGVHRPDPSAMRAPPRRIPARPMPARLLHKADGPRQGAQGAVPHSRERRTAGVSP